jgi:hypothetical protein
MLIMIMLKSCGEYGLTILNWSRIQSNLAKAGAKVY